MSSLDASTGLTCISCRLVFANSDLQRDHYRTEWHRYNVKRQAADLPPISQNDFADRVQTFTTENVSAQSVDENTYCGICKKPFQSKKAYENHVNSKKHREKMSSVDSPVESHEENTVVELPKSIKTIDLPIVEDVAMDDSDNDGSSSGWRTANSGEEEDYDENEAIPQTSCLFCSVASSSVSNNLTHMTKKHGFSIPDFQYCCDLEGLLKYLGMKIGCGNECVACSKNVKAFCNREACQKHMRDKNHCFVKTDGENILEYMDFYDYSELMTEEADDGFVDDGSFLVLPSGAKIGHRSLFRYFRQSLKSDANGNPIQRQSLAKLLTNGHIRALGWTEMSTSLAVQRARDMKCLKRAVDTYRLKQGLNANKLFKTRGRKDQQ